MKLIILAFAIIGCAAAQFDSATQGPNPQDIATPEPEYIDIDEPLPAPAAAPIPVQARSSFIPAQRPVAQAIPIAAPSFVHAPTQVIPIAAPSFVRAPTQAYLPPGSSHAQGGHVFSPQGGYQYRQVRRRFVYRRRY